MKIKYFVILGVFVLLIGGVFALNMYYLPDWIPQVGDIFHYEMINGEFVEQHIRGGNLIENNIMGGEVIGSRTIPIVD